MKKNNYTIPFALVFCLFFLWAISSNLLPHNIFMQLKKPVNGSTFPRRHLPKLPIGSLYLHFPDSDSYVYEAL